MPPDSYFETTDAGYAAYKADSNPFRKVNSAERRSSWMEIDSEAIPLTEMQSVSFQKTA